MSADDPRSKPQKPLADGDIQSRPVADRRTALVLGVAAVGVALTTEAAAQITDHDPGDPVGRGRGGGTGITDRDPTDPAGRGRGGNRTPPTTPPPQAQTGVTDRDPTDPAGRGRGPNAPRPPQAQTGVTDRDPTDPAGRGRGTANNQPRTTGITDRDAIDYPGNGRGAAGNTGWSDGDQGTQRDLPGRGRRPPQTFSSDNDIGPRADRRGNAPPPPPRAPQQAADVVDIGVGRNDAGRLIADARDVFTGRNDAARLREITKRREGR